MPSTRTLRTVVASPAVSVAGRVDPDATLPEQPPEDSPWHAGTAD